MGAVDRIDERGEKMALRGKRKRKKAKRGGSTCARNTNEGNGGQRSRRYRHKNKEERHTEPGTEQTANNAGRGGGSDSHTKNAQKNSFSKTTHLQAFLTTPPCVSNPNTRAYAWARVRYTEREMKEKRKQEEREKRRERRKGKKKEKGHKKKEEI